MTDFTNREPLLTPAAAQDLASAAEEFVSAFFVNARLDAHGTCISLLADCVENLSGQNARQAEQIADLTARLGVAEKRIHDLIEVHGS